MHPLLHVFAEVDIPRNTGDFRLMDRRAADALREHRERSRFVRGLFCGFFCGFFCGLFHRLFWRLLSRLLSRFRGLKS